MKSLFIFVGQFSIGIILLSPWILTLSLKTVTNRFFRELPLGELVQRHAGTSIIEGGYGGIS